MNPTRSTLALLILSLFSGGILAQPAPEAQTNNTNVPLESQQEKFALRVFLKTVEKDIVTTAEAMPADKYSFIPVDGEFKGVRSFGQQVKHLAATNHILAAAALGEEPPADAGDEAGPESVRTKAEVLDYLNHSFEHLGHAIDAIGEKGAAVRSSGISPLPHGRETRLALTVEVLSHSFNHYGQMVVHLRMNGVVRRPAVRKLVGWR